MKLFETYDLKTVRQCQFYSGFLPFKYLFDLNRMNFYLMLNASHVNCASILFHWFGQSEVRLKWYLDIFGKILLYYCVD